MSDEINYLDLLVLRKIDADSTVEKFGLQINSSFFEAANLLGSMKIKGLVDIQSSFGGNSPITITGEGRDLISMAITKAGEPIDSLDQTILSALVRGVKELSVLQHVINIRSRDLAFHLYKLKSYDYIDNDIRSLKVYLSLTEKGFLLTKSYRSTTDAASAAGKEGMKTESTAAANVNAKTNEGAQKEMPVSSGANSPPSFSVPPTNVEKSRKIEEEIKDLFNFASFKKPRDAKEGQPISRDFGIPPSSPVKDRSGILQKSAPGDSQWMPQGQKSPASASTGAQKPASSGSQKPVEGQKSAPSSTPATPSQSSFQPSQTSEGSGMPDKTTMFFSKIIYYLKKYGPFALLLFVLIAVLIIAFVVGIMPKK